MTPVFTEINTLVKINGTSFRVHVPRELRERTIQTLVYIFRYNRETGEKPKQY